MSGISRIVRFYELGGADVLRVEEREVPTPGDGEVLIAAETIGMNRADIMFRRGTYLEKAHLPSQLGFEAAGTIQAIGAGAGKFNVGDRVSVIPGFDLGKYGTYADHILMPEEYVVPLLPEVSNDIAAALWMAYLTAYGGLVEAGGLRAGNTVLITAASSSVGIAAIQVARRVGARVLATTLTGAKRDTLLSAGAHAVIAMQEESLSERLAILAPDGLQCVFDAVGGPDVLTFAAAMSHGGTIVIHGALSNEPTLFPVKPAIRKSLTVRGFVYTDMVHAGPARERATSFILEGVAHGSLRPLIDRTFSLSEIVEAHRYLESNQQIGKVIVKAPP